MESEAYEPRKSGGNDTSESDDEDEDDDCDVYNVIIIVKIQRRVFHDTSLIRYFRIKYTYRYSHPGATDLIQCHNAPLY